jgi:diadenylate cyclase
LSENTVEYYLNQLSNPGTLIDILIVTGIIYGFLMLIRGTRAVALLRGLLVLALLVWVLTLVLTLPLPATSWIFSNILPIFLFSIPVIFQPELRRALERLGRTGQVVRMFRRNRRSEMVHVVSRACLRLSQRRHGALIIFERDTGLQEYVDTGIVLEAEPSTELLLTIFNKNTELHDGAVIVRGEQVVAAACVMPLSTSNLQDRQMGLRHRAALGISEVSDAVAVIVSEETGQIAVAQNGRILRRQDPARLESILQSFLDARARIPIADVEQQKEALA